MMPERQKTASPSGQDLRAEFKGGTKFPTGDSIEHARGLLQKSQAVSEVNATPMPVKMHTPKYGTTKGNLPTFKGASMDEKIKNDPLVQHLRKEAGLREELGADSVGMNPPQGDPDAARFSQSLLESFNRHQDDTLTKLFSRASSARKHGLHNDKRGA